MLNMVVNLFLNMSLEVTHLCFLHQAVENLDKRGSKGEILMLHVINCYAKAVAKWFPPGNPPPPAVESRQQVEACSNETRALLFKARLRTALKAFRGESEQVPGDEVEVIEEATAKVDTFDEEVKKPDVPGHVKRAAQIMSR
jgi:hypothetical protein